MDNEKAHDGRENFFFFKFPELKVSDMMMGEQFKKMYIPRSSLLMTMLTM